MRTRVASLGGLLFGSVKSQMKHTLLKISVLILVAGTTTGTVNGQGHQLLSYEFNAAPGLPDTRAWMPGTNGSMRLVGTLLKHASQTGGDFKVLVNGNEIWSRSFTREDTIPHAVDISVIDLENTSVVEFFASTTSGSDPMQMIAAFEALPEPYLSGWSPGAPSGYPQWTEAEAQAKRDAGQAVLQQIRDASADGAARVVIQSGDYLFHANWSWDSTLSDLHNLDIDAEGVTFWFEPPMIHALLFENCSDVSVRGLTIDFTVPCWSQATITHIDRQAKTVSATFMPGYEYRDPVTHEQVTSGERSLMIFYKPDGRFINSTATRSDWQVSGDGASILYENITLAGIPAALEVGDYVICPYRTGAALRSINCTRMRFEDVNVWSSPGMGVYEGGGEGGHVYQRVRATRRPHTNRLHAFGADVFHLAGADRGPTLIRCESAYGGDDNINIHGNFGWIIERGEDDTLYYMKGTYVAGDTIEFRDSDSVDLLGTARVLSAVKNTTTIDADFLVALDQPLNLPVGSLVVMDGWESAGNFVIRDCWFHNSFQRTLINGTPGGVIENTTLQNVGEALRIQFETWSWKEGPFARNMVIRNNRFLNAAPNGVAIMVSMHPPGGGSDVRRFNARPFTNLTFSGNYFSQTTLKTPVIIHNVDGLTIQDNVVERLPYSSRDWLYLQDCVNVVIEANLLSPPPPFANGDFSQNATNFTEAPGYLGGANPSSIFAWTHNGTGLAGINGVGLSTPFGPSDPSAATYYIFLQSAGSHLMQDLSSTLEPDTTYLISYLAANRSGNAAALGRVTVEDGNVVFYDSSTQPWPTDSFLPIDATFTTGACFDGPVVITLQNQSPAGDNTVVYGNLNIEKVSPSHGPKGSVIIFR